MLLAPQWQLIITLCSPVPHILSNPVQYYCHTLLMFLWPLLHRWHGLGRTSKRPQGWVACLPGAQPDGKVRKLWRMYGGSLGMNPPCPDLLSLYKTTSCNAKLTNTVLLSSRLHHKCSIFSRISPAAQISYWCLAYRPKSGTSILQTPCGIPSQIVDPLALSPLHVQPSLPCGDIPTNTEQHTSCLVPKWPITCREGH